MKILETEVHEGTLIVALESFALWASKFGRELPPNFVEGISKGISQASSTVQVQTSYLTCFQIGIASCQTFDQVTANVAL